MDELQQQIDLQLAEGDADATDGDYWSTVAEQLGLARAEGVVADAFAHYLETVRGARGAIGPGMFSQKISGSPSTPSRFLFTSLGLENL